MFLPFSGRKLADTACFSTAQAEQQPQLRRLWSDTFRDSPAFLDLFFSSCFSPERTVVCTIDGQVRGAFYILACTLASPLGPLKAAYNYALAVDAPFRSRGLGGRLLRYLEETQRAQGVQVAILRPAEPSLFDYYARFGYTTRYRMSRRALLGEALPAPGSVSARPLPLEEWPALRNGLLDQLTPLSLRWGEDMLAYIWRHEHFFDGECWAFSGGLTGCAVTRREGDGSVSVRELLLNRPDDWQAAVAALHERYHASRYTLLAPPGCCGGSPVDYSFARWYDPALQRKLGGLAGYTGLLLD